MKTILRNLINKMGYDIIRINPSEKNKIGKNHLKDIKQFLHDDHPIIFDVGANMGQSIKKFCREFPLSTIHSFEPSPAVFEKLKQQVVDLDFKDVHLWNYALGSSSTQMTFLENIFSDMSSFLPLSDFGWGTVRKETLVEVKTIDQVCEEQKIEQIDLLKSDTQGFDLEVFKGAEGVIQSNKIGLIYFEVIFSDMYENIPPFSEVYDFLTSRNFYLVSFYEFHHQKQLASWSDALFVHKSYLKNNEAT